VLYQNLLVQPEEKHKKASILTVGSWWGFKPRKVNVSRNNGGYINTDML
jgi:hypothetical protein